MPVFDSIKWRFIHWKTLVAAIFSAGLIGPVAAQSSLPIYTDGLVNGFQDWSWTEVHDTASTTTVHQGTKSMGIYGTTWEGVSFHHADMDTSTYTNFVFWANGGSLGGQRLQIYVDYGSGASGSPYVLPGALAANTWQQFTIPLGNLGAVNRTNLSRINLQITASGSTNFFYLDDIQLTALPPPAVIPFSINTTQAVRTVDSRWFGVNVAIWDSYFDSAQTVSLFAEMGTRIIRLPGGSASDSYHWATANDSTKFRNFAHVATNANVNAQAIITVNYGTGTPAEAAAWVLNANITNHFGFKYWEVGNENYGTWETDSNSNPHDGYTYAVRAATYIAQMKAADATIKIGVPVITGENTYVNGYTSHPIRNSRTGTTNYGWTPVLLATLKSLGATPDFLVYHVYPEYQSDSDPALLQAAANWAPDAADLRQQVADYFGAGGTNIELLVTENNADAGSQGRQSTSIVNGLYYADSLGQVMKTEFNSFVWWDFRNGTDTGGDFNALLYGWRSYGDLGMVNGPTNRDPVFYAAKLMSYFAQPGDTVLNVTNVLAYPLLSAYAIRHASGSLSLLALNKDVTTNYNAQILLKGFTPGAAAKVYSYGLPQDEATRTNAVYPLQDIATNSFAGAGTNFSYNFPPYSLTMLTLIPSAPKVAFLPGPGGQFIMQVQGDASVRYIAQASTNLTTWTAVSTNIMAGNIWNVTNSMAQPRMFWRAAWLP